MKLRKACPRNVPGWSKNGCSEVMGLRGLVYHDIPKFLLTGCETLKQPDSLFFPGGHWIV